MAESVINVMKKLAQSGRTVICTIHQPSSTIYRQFDMVSGRGFLLIFFLIFGEPTFKLIHRLGFFFNLLKVSASFLFAFFLS